MPKPSIRDLAGNFTYVWAGCRPWRGEFWTGWGPSCRKHWVRRNNLCGAIARWWGYRTMRWGISIPGAKWASDHVVWAVDRCEDCRNESVKAREAQSRRLSEGAQAVENA